MMPYVLVANDTDHGTSRQRRDVLRSRALLFLTLLTVTGGGCGHEQSPARPTPVPPPPVEFSLFGSVVDTAFRPLGDVRVEVVDGPRAGTFVSTNTSGAYELPGTFSGAVTIQATKDGFAASTSRVGGQAGRDFVEIYLNPGTPSIDITGNYTIVFTADASCSELPDEVRTRTYTVTIAPNMFWTIPNQYGGALSGATFFPASRGNTFGVGVAGADASFGFGDPYDEGTSIVEEVGPSTYLAIWGGAVLPVGGPMISGSFDGTFQYCPSSTLAHGSGNIYHCPVQAISCSSRTHRVTLTRR